MNWLAYFQHNRTNRHTIPWELGITVEPHQRNPLIRSLQRFQVGESGEGRHLKKGAARTGDPDYQTTIDLFIAEEQEHARLLGKALDALGADRLTWHWSDAAFVTLRRLMGLHLELMVLLMAEMIALRYYRVLHDGTPDPVLRALGRQFLDDEVGHVSFHSDYLRRVFAEHWLPVRLVICGAWWLAYSLVSLVVAVDHRQVIGAMGVSPRTFLRDCAAVFDEVAVPIFFARTPRDTRLSGELVSLPAIEPQER